MVLFYFVRRHNNLTSSMSLWSGIKNLAIYIYIYIYHNLAFSPIDINCAAEGLAICHCSGSMSIILLVLIACLSEDSLCNRCMVVKAAKAIGRGTNWMAFACLIQTLLRKHTHERRRADTCFWKWDVLYQCLVLLVCWIYVNAGDSVTWEAICPCIKICLNIIHIYMWSRNIKTLLCASKIIGSLM